MQIMPNKNNLLSVPEELSLSFSGRNNKPPRSSDGSIDRLLEEGKAAAHTREEVAALLSDVMPEELGNVDAMLAEFRGREDELLGQLRRMEGAGRAPQGRVDPDDFIEEENDRENERGIGGFMDEWEQDLDHQLNGDVSAHSEPHSEPQPLSNPQGGSGRQLKSPPELLMAPPTEEKKQDVPSPYPNNPGHDDDEHDVPPHMPQVVRTNSQGHLQVSTLTAQSSLDGSEFRDQVGKRTVAMVKLNVWDPARPKGRLKCLATTHIILPNQDAAAGEENAAADARRAGLQREGSGSSKRKKRLSVVREEPERPMERGDSYYDDRGSSGNVFAKIASAKQLEEEDGEEGAEVDAEGNVDPVKDRAELRVGTVVGLQLKAKPRGSTSVASSVASGYSAKKTYDWTVGHSIGVHGVTHIPLTNLSELHYRIENNYASLRQLVLDGWPRSALGAEEAELLFEALGTNASVRRLSMRYSRVDDDLASLFALALVDNVALTQLSLEGNELTDVAAKNFYSVLRTNNKTLRLLDVGRNPRIDDDVLLALDQFMEQRALKRTLTNKAEKAKRAARGMPPDAALDDDEEEGEEMVTIVCPQSVMDGMLDRIEESDPRQDPPEADDASGINKPLPDESFRDYMERMDRMKQTHNQDPSYQKRLMNESMTERQAFDNFRGSGGSSDRQSPYQYLQVPDPESESQPQTPVNANASTGSSITTRSTTRRGPDGAIITTNSQRSEPKAVAWADTGRALPPAPQSIETQESADGPARPGARAVAGLQQSMLTEGTNASSSAPHPYHNTQTSRASNPSLNLSEEDYRDDKADERALRRQLAQSQAVGAYHMDEVAPARQSRAQGRRGRVARSESQRRARLAELAGSGTATANASSGGGTSGAGGISAGVISAGATEDVYDADIELAEEGYRQQMPRKKSWLSVIGLGDEDAGKTEKTTCALLVLLLVGLLVMIIILATK